MLPAGDGSYDHQRFFALDHCVGQRIIGRFVGNIFLAREEAQEGAALERVVIADGAAEHGVARFESVEDGAEGDRWFDFYQYILIDVRECAQMGGEDDLDLSRHFVKPQGLKPRVRWRFDFGAEAPTP